MEEQLKIVTTQNVGIDYEIASLGDRYVAGILDALAIIGYLLLFFLIIEMADLWYLEGWIYYLFLYLPILFYDLIAEIFFNGQSLGKYAKGLKVVNMDGSQVSIGGYLLRWLLRPVDVMISLGGVAVLSIIITGGQRLGDLAAGTTVVNLKSKVKLQDTLFTVLPENYEITFPEVNKLSDKDVSIIKEVVSEANKLESTKHIVALAERLAMVMEVSPELPPYKFITKVLEDFNYLHGGY